MPVESVVERKVVQVLQAWEKTYRRLRQKEIAVQADEAWPELDARRTEAEVKLVWEYVPYLLGTGYPAQDLRRVRAFLALQGRGRGRTKLEVAFWGNCCPGSPRVFVNVKNDVDIADIYGFTGFEYIEVFRRDEIAWSKREAQAFVKEVAYDLRHDGFHPRLGHTIICGALLRIDGTFE